MEKRQYYFAGVGVEISMPKERFYENEYRLTPFRTEGLINPHKICFKWVKELSEPQGNLIGRFKSTYVYENCGEYILYLDTLRANWNSAGLRVYHKEKVHEVEVNENIYKKTIDVKSVLQCLGVEQMLLDENAFVLHCSYIEVNGKAILFTAPSETGKSTQANLWEKLRGASIINGDKAAVRFLEDKKGVFAAGIPFAGSSEYCINKNVPLQAIVYLEQAPVTTVRRMSVKEAFVRIWEGSGKNHWNRENIDKLSVVVKRLIEAVPVFCLACTPDETAVVTLENALMKEC